MKITDEMVEAALQSWFRKFPSLHGDKGYLAEMRAALTAALAEQTQQGVEVKKLEWLGPRDAHDGEDAFDAFSAVGHYIATGKGWFILGQTGWYLSSDAKAAAQTDYETRIRSALVDVPAVESEPVAWIVREVTPSNGRGPNTIITGNVVPRGYEAITPLYAHPPRSLSTRKGSAGDGSATNTSGASPSPTDGGKNGG